MTLKEITEALGTLSTETEKRFTELVASLDTRIAASQKELYAMLLDDFVATLDVEGGKLLLNTANLKKVAALDALMDSFQALVLDAAVADFAQDLLAMRSMAADYYTATGWGKDVIERIKADMDFIEARIGLDARGNFTRGGYLETLAQTPELRQQLKNTVLQAMSANRSYTDFRKGLSEVVQGATGEDGFVQAYFQRYSHDAFNQIYEVSNKHFAESLGLKWFIYQGSIIKTSRRFCIKKVGKVFSTEEAEAWREDIDLIAKASRVSYVPLLERGRYNCRHHIGYISEALAKRLAPEKFA